MLFHSPNKNINEIFNEHDFELCGTFLASLTTGAFDIPLFFKFRCSS